MGLRGGKGGKKGKSLKKKNPGEVLGSREREKKKKKRKNILKKLKLSGDVLGSRERGNGEKWENSLKKPPKSTQQPPEGFWGKSGGKRGKMGKIPLKTPIRGGFGVTAEGGRKENWGKKLEFLKEKPTRGGFGVTVGAAD